MTHDQVQWALLGFCAGVFVCGVVFDLVRLYEWVRGNGDNG